MIWFQVGEELAHILSYHDLQASEFEVCLHCSGDAKLFADLTLFRRAISNVVSNALKHTPPKGSVTIQVGSGFHGVEILVKDTGGGIPSEHLPKLFDRFYRVDASRANSRAGTGLGLAIVKTIMDLHGGSVTLESELQWGTSVRLMFPVPVSLDRSQILRDL